MAAVNAHQWSLIRKRVLEYDEVIDIQRKQVYSDRDKVITEDDVSDIVYKMISYSVEETVNRYVNEAIPSDMWDIKALMREYKDKIEFDKKAKEIAEMSADEIHDYVEAMAFGEYEKKKEILGNIMLTIQKSILLQSIDENWMNHVDAMDELKRYIGLRSYAQRDPIVEYKKEGFEMFDDMNRNIKNQVCDKILELKIVYRSEDEEANDEE